MDTIFKSQHNQYRDLADYIDRSSVKDLEVFFPKLVEEIFDLDSQFSWGLRTLKTETQYNTYFEVYNFLQPNGPMFRMCYKLLSDCHIQYEFPYQQLPEAVKRKIEDSNEVSYYKKKITPTLPGQIRYINLNALEYYIFHFAYHLINPSLLLDANTVDWDTIYLRLVEVYLDHFVPCTTSVVTPILHHSSTAILPSTSSLESYSPVSRSSVSIFREDVIKKMSPNPSLTSRSKSVSCTEIWRTELVSTVFLDFWMSINKIQPSKSFVFPVQKLWLMESLPSKEQLRCIRILLKHLHYFANHMLPEDCPMNDFKKEILFKNRVTIYNLFRCCITQLPLDSSYKLLLEGWFTYLQPWRYTNPYSKNMSVKESRREKIDRSWFPFIAENLIMYTNLYYTALTRLSRCDLTTHKISSIFHRILQVFSQPHLLGYIAEVEKYIDEGSKGSISSWNSIIRQNIINMEKSDFNYEFFYSQNHTKQALEFITQIENSLPILQSRKKKIQETDNKITFVGWFKEQLSGNIPYSSTEDLQKIEYFLEQSLQKLYTIHKIPSTAFLTNKSNESYDSVDGSFMSSMSINDDPRQRRKAALFFRYEGDPDLYPIRSWENKFLVRCLYFVCLWINTQFQRDIKKLYRENNIRGGIFRQILRPPQRVYYFEKKNSPNGYSEKVPRLLSPRLSLRWCASYYNISIFFLFFMITRFLQFSGFTTTCFIFIFYFCYLLMNSIFFDNPVVIEDSQEQ